MRSLKERIKGYIYILLLTNIAIASFQVTIQNPTIKIILAIYTILTLLLTIIYVKRV